MGSCIFGRRLSLWRVPGVGADMSARRKHEEIVSYSRTLGPRSAVRGRDSGARRLHGQLCTGHRSPVRLRVQYLTATAPRHRCRCRCAQYCSLYWWSHPRPDATARSVARFRDQASAFTAARLRARLRRADVGLHNHIQGRNSAARPELPCVPWYDSRLGCG